MDKDRAELESLQQALNDLKTTQSVALAQLEEMLTISFKKMSKRSVIRVLQSVANYPNEKSKVQLIDGNERALLEQMLGIKDIQLRMMMIANSLGKRLDDEKVTE